MPRCGERRHRRACIELDGAETQPFLADSHPGRPVGAGDQRARLPLGGWEQLAPDGQRELIFYTFGYLCGAERDSLAARELPGHDALLWHGQWGGTAPAADGVEGGLASLLSGVEREAKAVC